MCFPPEYLNRSPEARHVRVLPSAASTPAGGEARVRVIAMTKGVPEETGRQPREPGGVRGEVQESDLGALVARPAAPIWQVIRDRVVKPRSREGGCVRATAKHSTAKISETGPQRKRSRARPYLRSGDPPAAIFREFDAVKEWLLGEKHSLRRYGST